MKRIINKSKKYSNFAFLFIIISCVIAINQFKLTKSFASDSVEIIQKGESIKIIYDSKGSALTYPRKVLKDNTNIFVYCLQKTRKAPTLDANAPLNLVPLNVNKYKGLEYILENGQTTATDIKKNKYLNGNEEDNYYITQGAIHCYLSKLPNDGVIAGEEIQKFKWVLDRTLSGRELDIRNRIVSLANDAQTYAEELERNQSNLELNTQVNISENNISLDAFKLEPVQSPDIVKLSTNISKLSTKSESITINTSDLGFKERGETFESNNITVNTQGNSNYTLSVEGLSDESYDIVISNGQNISNSIPSGVSFKIVVHKNKINKGTYSIKVNISANIKVNDWNAFYAPGKEYQAILVPAQRGSNGSSTVIPASKETSGKFTYCGQPVTSGEWIESKKINIDGYEVKEGNNKVATLEPGKTYDVGSYIKYVYSLIYEEYKNTNTTPECPPVDIPKPSQENAGYSGTIDYNIKFIDFEGNKTQGKTGKLSPVNFTVPNGKTSHTDIKNAPTFKLEVPKNSTSTSAEITLILKNPKGEQVDSKVILLPIKLEFDTSYSIEKIETNLDDCKDVNKGGEISLKTTVKSNDIKTKNFDVQFQVKLNDGSYTNIGGVKTVYGVSRGLNGATYIKYKVPEQINGVDVKKVQFRAIFPNDTNSSKISKQFNVTKMTPEYYDSKSDSPKREFSLPNGKAITYLKVQKRDKVIPEYANCSGCQGPSNNRTCPGKCKIIGYKYGEWYTAFVPKETVTITNVKETVTIESVLLRTKYTKQNSDKAPIDKNGYLNLVNLNSSNYDKYTNFKAGYGFELIIKSKYENNLPERLQSVNRTNTVTSGSPITEYKPFTGSSPVKLVYKNIDEELKADLTNNKPVMFISPAADELAYETLNQLYIKMPDGKYTYVSKGLDLTNGKGVNLTPAQRDSITHGQTIENNKIIREKYFEFSVTDGFRKYYISPDVKNDSYNAKIFTPFSGMRLQCNDTNMPRESYTMKINLSGGYTDDLKTQLND